LGLRFRPIILLIPAIFCIQLAYQEDGTSSECKCWDGYEVTNNSYCLGVTWLTYNKDHKCNEPVIPDCKCTNITAKLIDAEGTWCAFYQNGTQLKKWNCENTEDWNQYRKSYKEFTEKYEN
jgi:hypothetical protein